MGVRVIIDYSAQAGKSGDAYYRMFPREPSAAPEWDMTIDPDEIVRLEGMTLLKLLEAMAAPPVESVVLVLTHGTVERDSDGLAMDIGPAARGRESAGATTAALTAIYDCAENLRKAEQEIRPLRDPAAWVRFIRSDLGGTDYQGFLDALDWAGEISQLEDAGQRAGDWERFLSQWGIFLAAFRGGSPRGSPPRQADQERISQWLAEIRSSLLGILERYPQEQYLQNVAAYELGVDRETLERVIAKREELRGRLDRVEFRACNLGKLDFILAALQRFFGAGSVTAPRNFMLYGKVDPVISFPDSTFQQWVETNEGPAMSTVYEGTVAPSELAFQESFLTTQVCYRVLPGQPNEGEELCVPHAWRDPTTDTFFLKIWEAAVEPRHEWGISAAARSTDDARNWVDHNVYPKSDYAGGGFYVAAIWTFGEPGVDQPYVLPLSLDYRAMIRSFPSS
jgi:hypothetical protein